MKIYIKRHDGVVCEFSGMDRESIISTLEKQGISFEFITEDEFRSEILRQKALINPEKEGI